MLVIDEIHSLLAGTFREQRIFLNSLRFFGQWPAHPSGLLGHARGQAGAHDWLAVGLTALTLLNCPLGAMTARWRSCCMV
jgi:hypothetical protein